MANAQDETSASTRRRQHQQQIRQQQAQQSRKRCSPDLPDKQHQTHHNSVSDTLEGKLCGEAQ